MQEKLTKKRRREIEREIAQIDADMPFVVVKSMNYSLVKGSPEHAALRAKIHEMHARRKELRETLGGTRLDAAAISAAVEEGEKKRKEKRERQDRVKKFINGGKG